MTQLPCILREGLGFTERISFPVFASYIIQDDDVAKEIAEWLIEDNSKARLQLQIHKYVWSPVDNEVLPR